MNELVTMQKTRNLVRRGLLATVSAIALLAATSEVEAASNDHAPFWIELSGQFAQEQVAQEGYSPPFLAVSPFVTSASSLERSSRASWDGAVKFSFETNDGWIFSAAVRYGKTSRDKAANHQTSHPSHTYSGYPYGAFDAYQLIRAKASESHTILDFQAGKDVGLGVFGNSVLSAGVRFAQFTASTDVTIQSQPTNINAYGYYHVFRAKFDATRHFNGIGPSVSWAASTNLFGNPSSSAIALDWGVNGSVLFGRQHVNEEHQTTDNYKHQFQYLNISTTHGGAPRSKSAVVPNLGGFAGLSWQAPHAKVTFGYRADVFFGAMDGGIDIRKTYNRGFFGPYAAVSIGLP
jgi:hypothetical protein